MLLPGKLCIGVLEEDNPLRSYFRFKPLLIDDDGRYVPCEDEKLYPDEGCIRIVPDKNESYHFKTRMREIGQFCVVDLRDHPNENDKIRPNKNYRPNGEENNACIIYSDVVRSPMPDMIFEILPDEAQDKPIQEPATECVLVREGEGLNPILYKWEPIVGSDGMVRLTPVEAPSPVEDLQVFEMTGFRGRSVSFGIKPAGIVDRVCDAPENRVSAEPRQPVAVQPAPAEMEAEVKVAEQTEPETDTAAETPTEPESKPEAQMAAKPQTPQRAEETVDEPEKPVRKPWLHHDESMVPRPVNPKLSRAEQILAAQSGLNPRKGRSLHELIDEKWQHSRIYQLGQPVTIPTGAPVQNPVENAIMAIRATWGQPQLRKPLLEGIAGLEDFHQSMRVMHESAKTTALNKELNALEAQKFELLAELDRLKQGNQALRNQLKQEIRNDEIENLREAVEKTEAARAEQARYEALAEEARVAAQDAQDVLETLTGEKLERAIREVALTQRVAERMEALRDVSENPVPPAVEKIDFNAFMERVKRRFEAEGRSLSEIELANLCVCLTISPVLFISGAPGSGKTSTAQMLLDALGWTDAKRVALFAPEAKPLDKDARIAALKRVETAPAALVLDDANLCESPDLLRGMAQALPEAWRMLVTLQDRHSGTPVSAGTLDKGFLVRLAMPSMQRWQPATRVARAEEAFASMTDIAATLPQAEMPTALAARMDTLLNALRGEAALSRRALDDTWRYCAAMAAILGDQVEPNAIWDLALAQRLLPSFIGCAPVRTVMRLRDMTANLPACARLFEQPAPIMV